MSKVSELYSQDSAFREVADLLFGGGADDLIHKMSPEGPDLSAGEKKKQRRQAQVGLASNVVGLGAGVLGTKEAYGSFKRVKNAKPGTTIASNIKISGKTKALAAGALGLQVANVAGDAVANRVLARSAAEPKKKPVKKNDDGFCITTAKGKLYAKAADTGVTQAKKAAPKVKVAGGKLKTLAQETVAKRDNFDVVWEGEISKVDTDRRQVFGWASIVEMNGEPVVDLQGDYISIEEIEKSAYEYVIKSRKGGDMHQRVGEEPLHASDMIESFLVTPEKIAKMGLPEGSLPLGWWVGYKVNDDNVWNLVKSGGRTGFSIHGRGQRSSS